MEDGELDSLNQEFFQNSNLMDQIPSTSSMDSFFDDILKESHVCSHTHTCNPPGPDFSHTHTCFHVHTKILPVTSDQDEKVTPDDIAESSGKTSKKRPVGNREAVRKYREKKKARTASLEEEVVRLRALNQHLMKRLHSQAVLEAEVKRLKCLLVDIRGRIEGEIGSFPYQKMGNGDSNIVQQHLSNHYVFDSCNANCDDQVYCNQPGVECKAAEGGGLNGHEFGDCGITIHQCQGSPNLELEEFPGCTNGSSMQNVDSRSKLNKKKKGPLSIQSP